MNYYLEMLRKSIKRIEADFDFSAIIDHNCSKGTFREQILKNFLRPFLPGCYGVSGGQAFDNDGKISKQLDVVVYSTLSTYVRNLIDHPDPVLRVTPEELRTSIELLIKICR